MAEAALQAADDKGLRLGPGALVLVVGPSGAGKDTLIRIAKAQFASSPAVLFPRRLITRGPDEHEDHVCVAPDAFRQKIAAGDMALAWNAHGLDYGVPGDIDVAIAAGKVVVINVSRRVIPTALMKYTRVFVVYVIAPAEVLAERLARRGRENAADVAARLDRAVDVLPNAPEVVVLQNVGEPEIVAQKLIDLIAKLAESGERAGGAEQIQRGVLHF